jgi:Zn-dependent protease with chaperone function
MATKTWVVALVIVAVGLGALVLSGAGRSVAATLLVVAVFVATLVGLQWALNPWLFERMVRAEPVPLNEAGDGYVIDHPVGPIVARRCAEAGIGLVRLAIIDDGTPNACCFGHHRSDARLWVTRGLLARLTDDELDAVIAHEIGHIVNHDFVIMTVACGLPILAYWVVLSLGDNNDEGSGMVVLGALAVYVLSLLGVSAISRRRESNADLYSCRVTGNGDALCAALVKIGYGLGQVKAERDEAIRVWKQTAKTADKAQRKELRRQMRTARRQDRRVQTLRVLGIADTDRVPPFGGDLPPDPHAAIAALAWDATNPWSRFTELWASHPSVAHRVTALAGSGVPGAPTTWADTVALAPTPPSTMTTGRFVVELVVRYGGAVAILGAIYLPGQALSIGCLLVAAVLVAVWAAWTRPLTGPSTPDGIADLLARTDASPVRTVQVNLHGHITGRALPGHLLSADLVLADATGFVPLTYHQPWPFGRTKFALTTARCYQDQPVQVRGWYTRNSNGPSVAIRDIIPATGPATRSRQWVVRYTLAAILTLAVFGIVVLHAVRPN